MSFELSLRLMGMAILSVGGLKLGLWFADTLRVSEPPELWGMVFLLIGSLAGLILTPHLTTRPAQALRDRLYEIPAQQLVASIVGLIIGLIIAALLSLPLALLPQPYGSIFPVISAIVLGYFGVTILSTRRRDIFNLFQGQIPIPRFGSLEDVSLAPTRQVLLDTSVIIDGRIADIAQTGFIMATMLVPRFVLNELQHVADSSDPIRRNRGRRGLDILNVLQKEALVPIQITDLDIEESDQVDEKLVLLARELGCAIVTNDFNLNRVAILQDVMVLNINDLANAIKAVFLPGEMLDIRVIQEGKELGQGVGYLEDGTMVVIEGGRAHIDNLVSIEVTKVLQTSAGRMIFARLKDG